MSRVSGCLWLGVALVLALVAGGVAFVTLQKATVTQAQADAPVATTSVVVASHPLPVGVLLTEADLALQTMPVGVVPAGALSSIDEATGKVATTAFDVGEMVLQHHITQPDITGTNLAFTLPEGLVGVSLSADDLLSQLAVVEVGDHVDLHYTLGFVNAESGDETQYTFGTLQNVIVVSVARNASPEGEGTDQKNPVKSAARAYILALDPQDALVLKFLKDAGAVMDLALRNVADESEHAPQPVNADYLIDRFQLAPR